MTRGLVLIVSLVFAACGPAAGECPFTASFGAAEVPFVAGGPVMLELEGSASTRCAGYWNELAVTAQAVGADGSIAAVTVSSVQRSTQMEEHLLSARLEFEPTVPGLYTVTVQVDPIDAEVSERVTVAIARPEARTHLLTLPEGECVRALETARGTLICDDQVFRDGEAVQTLPGFLGIGGNVVWSYSNGVVRRYVDSGEGALVQDPPVGHSVVHDFPAAPGYFEAATETEWVISHGGDLNRFRLGTNFLTEEESLLPFRGVAFDGVIRRDTHVVLHVEAASSTTRGSICRVEAPADGPMTLVGECVADEREVFFSEPDGRSAWRCVTRDDGLASCVLDAPSASGLVTEGELSLALTGGFTFEPNKGYTATDSVRGLLPKRVDGVLHLEEAVLPEGWRFHRLTETRIVARHSTLEQVAFFAR